MRVGLIASGAAHAVLIVFGLLSLGATPLQPEVVESISVDLIPVTGYQQASFTGLKWFGARLPPDVYYIDRLPVNVDLVDYAIIAIAAVFISAVSTIYPAYSASRLSPIEGLHHE